VIAPRHDAAFPDGPDPTNSHEKPRKPRPSAAVSGRARTGDPDSQNDLAASREVPLHVRPVLSYAEVAALGIVPERTLRRLVTIGKVKRSLIRTGRRVRFVVRDLLDELRDNGD
jgi:hypothetical protein